MLIVAFMFILAILATYLITDTLADIGNRGEEIRLGVEVENIQKENTALRTENERLNRKLEQYKGTYTEDIMTENAKLENDLVLANERIAELEAQLANLNQINGGDYEVIGAYDAYISLDDDCTTNLITAMNLVNGTSIRSGKTKSIAGILGSYRDSGYVLGLNPNEPEYASGVEYLTNGIYMSTISANLQVMRKYVNAQGFVYVTPENDLIIKNNSDNEVKIKCGYDRGHLSVTILSERKVG